MSSLGRELVKAITRGGSAPATSLPAMVRELIQLTGSQNKAARAAGVGRSTFQNLVKGLTRAPKALTVDRIARGYRAAVLSPERPTDSSVTLTVADRSGGRERSLTGDKLLLESGTMRRVADAWVRTGNSEAVAIAFVQGIGDSFYRTWLSPVPEWRTRRGDDQGDDDDDQGDDEFGYDDEEPDEGDEWYDDWYDVEGEYDHDYGDADGDYGAAVLAVA